MQKFKIYASKIEYDDVEQQKRLYTIDHTILTYLIDDQSEYMAHLGSNLSENDLSDQIVSKIKEDQK